MDPTVLIGELVEKGLLGMLLALSLWANLKQYQHARDLQERTLQERALRLEDKNKATEALLGMNDKVHQALDKTADILERSTIGTRIAP